MSLGKWVCTREMGSSILMCISCQKGHKVSWIVEGIATVDVSNLFIYLLF
jgi:acyl-CoA hydrolase